MGLSLRCLFERMGIVRDQQSQGPGLHLPLFVNEQQFYSPTVVRDLVTILPDLYVSAQSFFDPTVSTGAATILAPKLTNAQTFFAPNIGTRVAAPLFTNSQSFLAPRLDLKLFPSRFTNSQVFYGPTVARNVETVVPTLFTNSQTFYGPTVSYAAQTVAPSLFTNVQAFLAPSIGTRITASKLTNAPTFFGPKLSPQIAAPKLSNVQTFFGPTITRGSLKTILPSLYVNPQSFFGPKVKPVISPAKFTNAQTFFGPTVSLAGSSVNLTQYRGTLTKAGAGAVNIGSLDPSPYVATSSTYTLTSGTAGHWTLPTDGTTPVPTSAGDTADLNGGPYVFAYTATVGSTTSSGNLTINTRASTYTVSLRTEVAAVLTAGIDGKTVELARGATDLSQSTAAAPLHFNGWRPTTSCTVKNEDATNPTKLGNIYIRCSNNVTFDGLTIYPAARSTATAIDKAIFVNTLTPSTFGLTSTSTNVCTFNNITVTGDGDPTHAVQSWYIQAAGAPVGLIWTGTIQQTWCQDAFNLLDSGDYGITIDASAAYVKTRYWTGDALFTTAGASGLGSLTFSDLLFMSPMWDSSRSAIHLDTWQNQADVSNMPISIDRLTMIQADGNVNGQTIFTKGTAKIALTIKNAISVSRSVHTCTICGTDATHVTDVRNYTGIQQWSGTYGVEDTANGRNDHPDGAFAPGIVLETGIDAAYITLGNMFMAGTLSNTSTYMPPSSVVCQNSPDVSAHLPNAGWISSTSLKSTAMLPANDVDYYAGLDDSRWHADTDTVLASVISALTPASGQVGALKSDGTRPLV